MFKTRLLSGIILLLAALALVITGDELLLAGLLVISLIGLFEIYRVFHIEKTVLGFVGYLLSAVYYADLQFHFIPDSELFVLTSLILFMAVFVFSFPKYKAEQVFAAFTGIFYVSVMLSCVYQTRMLTAGVYIVWIIFLCSWGCDTCAYCVGVLIGKHKMAPKLSPKKSIEGAVGGVAGTVLLTIFYGFLFQKNMGISKEIVFVLACISGIGALLSMIGDLAASAVKRNYAIKDYGTLIPGHGGILDRFDSVIFTAPIVYYLALYLI